MKLHYELPKYILALLFFLGVFVENISASTISFSEESQSVEAIKYESIFNCHNDFYHDDVHLRNELHSNNSFYQLRYSLISAQESDQNIDCNYCRQSKENLKFTKSIINDRKGVKESIFYGDDELVDSWKKLDDLGDAIPDAIKRNPDILSKTRNWSDDLYSKLGAVKERNPTFFDRVNDDPRILEFFEEGSSIISNKAGNLKAVDLDMYALDRARPEKERIFELGTTDYVINTYANLHRIDNGSGTGGVNLQSGKIRDANGNVISTDNVNGEGLMYVIDEFDNIHIGGRGGAMSYPHPTLIGGANPNVKSAGMIKFKDGRILEVNRNSGHFKKLRGFLLRSFRKTHSILILKVLSMDYKEVKGKYGWVAVHLFRGENFEKFIHPQDLKRVKAQNLQDAVFKCLEVLKDDYLLLESTEITMRTKKEIFDIMSVQPSFKPLEKVKYISSKGKLEFGVVVGISWHNNENRHIYYLEVNGKKKSRRYHSEDLQKIEE